MMMMMGNKHIKIVLSISIFIALKWSLTALFKMYLQMRVDKFYTEDQAQQNVVYKRKRE